MTNTYDERAKKDLVQIGKNIATLRKGKQYSQEVLAEKVGLSTVDISLIESVNVDNNCSMEVIYSIASALDVAPEELFKGTSAF